MNSSTGRWVSGDNFFNRERELQILEMRVRDRNHILLTGQRRMGKTSIVQELGRRLEAEGWWSARFRDHHIPLANRHSDDESSGDAQ